MSYLVVNNTKSYTLKTDTPSVPYLKVSNSYLQLTTCTNTNTGLNIRNSDTNYSIVETKSYSTTISTSSITGYSGAKSYQSATGTYTVYRYPATEFYETPANGMLVLSKSYNQRSFLCIAYYSFGTYYTYRNAAFGTTATVVTGYRAYGSTTKNVYGQITQAYVAYNTTTYGYGRASGYLTLAGVTSSDVINYYGRQMVSQSFTNTMTYIGAYTAADKYYYYSTYTKLTSSTNSNYMSSVTVLTTSTSLTTTSTQ